MSRLRALFERKKSRVLNIYCTAGFPELESTLPVMQALQDNGADLIEIGMPYSDPLADGPVIQASSSVALHNGMTIAVLLRQLAGFREKISVPVLLMGYLNPVLQYGFEPFCRDAAAAGVDGLILPDLPMFEYETEYGAIIRAAGLDLVFLVTPETSETRIRQLDKLSRGFLYAVSSSSTTGNNRSLSDQEPYFRKLKEMNLDNPLLIGFGIRDSITFNEACSFASGAIIGTAYIKAIEGARASDINPRTKAFLNQIL